MCHRCLHNQLELRLLHLLKLIEAGEEPANLAGSARETVEWCAKQKWLVQPQWEKRWNCYRRPTQLEFELLPDGPVDRRQLVAFFGVFHSLRDLLLDAITNYRARKFAGALRDHLCDYLSLRGHDIDAIAESATNVPPAEPTKKYCLIPPRSVRWAGREVELQNRLYRMLEYVLTHHKKGGSGQIPCKAVEHHMGRSPDQNGKFQYVAKASSALNKSLKPIDFPWKFSTEDDLLFYG
jgi:hypothetical protein